MKIIYWSLLDSRFTLQSLLCDNGWDSCICMYNEDALQLPQWGLTPQLLFQRWQRESNVWGWRQSYSHSPFHSLLVLVITSLHSSGHWHTLLALSSECLCWAAQTLRHGLELNCTLLIVSVRQHASYWLCHVWDQIVASFLPSDCRGDLLKLANVSAITEPQACLYQWSPN